MKLRIRALLLAAMFVVSLLPVMSMATDVPVSNDTDLANAISNATGDTTIVLASGTYSGNYVIHQQEGVNLTIKGDGQNTKFSGHIEIYGHCRYQKEETLIFDGVVFETSVANHVFVEQTEQTGNANSAAKCYPHNVSFVNCKFVATGAAVNTAVGAKFRYGYNNSVINSTATGMHSLMQNYACVGLTIDQVKIENCKNGIALGTSQGVTVSNSTIKTTGAGGYGLRFDAQGIDNNSAIVEDCDVEAYVPVLLRKATSEEYTLTVTGECDMTATNATGKWCVATKTDFDETETTIVAPDAAIDVVLDDTNAPAAGIGGVDTENVTVITPPAYAGPVMNWVKVNTADNGVVKSGPLAASAGATVTLYPKAAAGYVLDTVEVLDAEGNAVELDGLKFAIPAGGVTVNATFKLAE